MRIVLCEKKKMNDFRAEAKQKAQAIHIEISIIYHAFIM